MAVDEMEKDLNRSFSPTPHYSIFYKNSRKKFEKEILQRKRKGRYRTINPDYLSIDIMYSTKLPKTKDTSLRDYFNIQFNIPGTSKSTHFQRQTITETIRKCKRFSQKNIPRTSKIYSFALFDGKKSSNEIIFKNTGNHTKDDFTCNNNAQTTSNLNITSSLPIMTKPRLLKRRTLKPKHTRRRRINKLDYKTTINKSSISNKISQLNTEKKLEMSHDQILLKSSATIDINNYPLDNMQKCKFSYMNYSTDNIISLTLRDPIIEKYTYFPSVTEIMEETQSNKTKLVLNNWRKNIVRSVGEEGLHNRSEALKTRGTEFHLAVRNAVLGKVTENCSQVIQNSLRSLSWMLEFVSSPLAVESAVVHPTLGYKGIVDCVALFRDVPVVIDWKLSDKPKTKLKDTYDAPVQVTAYIGALNHDVNYKWKVSHGVVAVAYTSGEPCDVFVLAPQHCHIYWSHWLMRIQQYKNRSHLHLEHDIDLKDLGLPI